MKIRKIRIHNFRSIHDQEIVLNDYAILVGANNSGKTNIIDALRIFYEKDIKYTPARDDPKFSVDGEGWIEIEYQLDNDEFINLKDEYKDSHNKLKVRKYLRSNADKGRVKSGQSNIYGYEDGVLSEKLFYGAKNISEAKLGNVIYIPEVTKADEYTKLSGPSAFRNLLEFVVKKVVKKSAAFEKLSNSFDEFDKKFRKDESVDGISLNTLICDINKEIEGWKTTFDIDINRIKPEAIIKNLVSYHLEDGNLKGERMDLASYGQGFQRHLIYTLIKLSADYREPPKKTPKKEFSPEMTLLLFEEPEAFLHPTQQEIMNTSLRHIGQDETTQVIITTHSTHFVSKNFDDIISIVKLARESVQTVIYQMDDEMLKELFVENTELKRILGGDVSDEDIHRESIRYCLWLDPDRSTAFFSDAVLICEGLSEKALIDKMIKEGRISTVNRKPYILNAAGKYDIHRYMNIFGKLGIKHAVLYDGDKDKGKHGEINKFVQNCRNDFTLEFYGFEGVFEDFLGIEKHNDRYKRPISVIQKYEGNLIKSDKINEFIKIVQGLLR